MILRSFHRTVYCYSNSAIESHNEVRLEPVDDAGQRRISYSLTTSPVAKIFEFDEVGGKVHYFTVRSPHSRLEIVSESHVETLRINPFDGLNLLIKDIDYFQQESIKHEFAEFLVPSTYVSLGAQTREIAEIALEKANGVSAQFYIFLNKYLYDLLTYDSDVTHVHSTVNEVLELQAGVCQDFAHVMIACCRSVGIPARYVSGYLHSSSGSGIRGSTGMHAWVETPLPGGGWLALDPTNNLLANDHHVKVHTGRDYADISPLKGLYIGSRAKSMDVEIWVERVQPADAVGRPVRIE